MSLLSNGKLLLVITVLSFCLAAIVSGVLPGFAASPQSTHAVIPQEVSRQQTEDLQRKIADLTKRLDALESSIKVTPGSITIKGVISLNNGGRPVARVGDTVSVSVSCPPGGGKCTGIGEIITGSSTVLAN